MQISQFKNETDFASAAPPPEGYYLRWVKQNADGTATEYIKDHTGAVKVLNAGSGGGISDAPTDGKIYGRKDADWTEVSVGGASALADLSDVSGAVGASNGQALVYDAEAGKWMPGAVSGNLPGSPGNDDIPIYSEIVSGGGNDDNTKVLLHFDAVPFVNSALGGSAVVSNGGGVTLAETGKFGKSAYFPGAGDVASTLVLDYTAETLNALDSCRIDLWFKGDGTQPHSYPVLFSSTQYDGDRHALEVGFNNSSGTEVSIAISRYVYTTVTPTGGFDHVAFIKAAGQWSVYFNGARVINPTVVTLQGGNLGFGARIYGGTYRSFKGWIDEFRIQTGDMSGFTGETIPVPDAPYSPVVSSSGWGTINKSELGGNSLPTANPNELLMWQEYGGGNDENTIVLMPLTDDLSNTAVGAGTVTVAPSDGLALTVGEAYFGNAALKIDADTQQIVFDFGSELVFYPNSWTIEFMLYLDGMPLSGASWFLGDGQWGVYVYPDGGLGVGIEGVSENKSSVGAVSAQAWYHVAFCRDISLGNMIYVNGQRVGGTLTANSRESSTLTLNNHQTARFRMQSLRISKVCRYYTDFTPPTMPFSETVTAGYTPVTLTKLAELLSPLLGES